MWFRAWTCAGLGCLAVHWFFTGLLIAASAGTVVFGGFLLRRLFTTDPVTSDTDTASGEAAS